MVGLGQEFTRPPQLPLHGNCVGAICVYLGSMEGTWVPWRILAGSR